jgi:hypothetical protein
MRRAFKITVLLLCVPFVFVTGAFAGGDISQDRAHQLAQWYFVRYFPREGCGGAQSPKLQGDYWESTVGIGYAVKPSGTILIQRHTGRISYRGPFLLKPSTSAESLAHWAQSYGQR